MRRYVSGSAIALIGAAIAVFCGVGLAQSVCDMAASPMWGVRIGGGAVATAYVCMVMAVTGGMLLMHGAGLVVRPQRIEELFRLDQGRWLARVRASLLSMAMFGCLVAIAPVVVAVWLLSGGDGGFALEVPSAVGIMAAGVGCVVFAGASIATWRYYWRDIEVDQTTYRTVDRHKRWCGGERHVDYGKALDLAVLDSRAEEVKGITDAGYAQRLLVLRAANGLIVLAEQGLMTEPYLSEEQVSAAQSYWQREMFGVERP